MSISFAKSVKALSTSKKKKKKSKEKKIKEKPCLKNPTENEGDDDVLRAFSIFPT